MSQAYQLYDPAQPGPYKETPKTDWTKYLRCQKVTSEALQCPAESKRYDVGTGQGYSTFIRLDALAKALSVIATATWLAGWLGVRHTPVLYQNG